MVSYFLIDFRRNKVKYGLLMVDEDDSLPDLDLSHVQCISKSSDCMIDELNLLKIKRQKLRFLRCCVRKFHQELNEKLIKLDEKIAFVEAEYIRISEKEMAEKRIDEAFAEAGSTETITKVLNAIAKFKTTQDEIAFMQEAKGR